MESKIYIQASGKFVDVNDTVYRSFYSSSYTERNHLQKEGKCFCPQKQVWRCDCDCGYCPFFVPLGADMQQPSQSYQYPISNAQQPKYTFNNVPPEQADSITHNVIAYQPQASVEVNFASPALKSGSPFIPVDELRGIIDILPE